MCRFVQVSIMVMVLIMLPAQAHEGHEHGPVTMKKAVEIALAVTHDTSHAAASSPGFPPLDQSWRKLPASAARIYENGRGYYVVSVENPVQSKTLFVRILLDGRVDGANFSGEFVSSPATSSAGL